MRTTFGALAVVALALASSGCAMHHVVNDVWPSAHRWAEHEQLAVVVEVAPGSELEFSRSGNSDDGYTCALRVLRGGPDAVAVICTADAASVTSPTLTLGSLSFETLVAAFGISTEGLRPEAAPVASQCGTNAHETASGSSGRWEIVQGAQESGFPARAHELAVYEIDPPEHFAGAETMTSALVVAELDGEPLVWARDALGWHPCRIVSVERGEPSAGKRLVAATGVSGLFVAAAVCDVALGALIAVGLGTVGILIVAGALLGHK
jgi:hypothetical protein